MRESVNCDNGGVSPWVGKGMSRDLGESELGTGASSREGGGDLSAGPYECPGGSR